MPRDNQTPPLPHNDTTARLVLKVHELEQRLQRIEDTTWMVKLNNMIRKVWR